MQLLFINEMHILFSFLAIKIKDVIKYLSIMQLSTSLFLFYISCHMFIVVDLFVPILNDGFSYSSIGKNW